MKTLTLVGCGGIGFRHLQSCLTLDPTQWQIELCEPRVEMRERAAAEAAAAERAPRLRQCVADIAELDNGTTTVAIVATDAKVRAMALEALIERRPPKAAILEKVLFQTLIEYADSKAMLQRAGVTAVVNCTRRVWPVYCAVVAALLDRRIEKLDVNFVGGDLGCIGIHILDLLAFMIQDDDFRIDTCSVGGVMPAKRTGQLFIAGHLTGSVGTVPFTVNAPSGEHNGLTVSAHCADGFLGIHEADGMVKLSGSLSAAVNFPPISAMPLQSQLTANCVMALERDARACTLTSFDSSRRIHEAMITAFLDALTSGGRLIDAKRCPIT